MHVRFARHSHAPRHHFLTFVRPFHTPAFAHHCHAACHSAHAFVMGKVQHIELLELLRGKHGSPVDRHLKQGVVQLLPQGAHFMLLCHYCVRVCLGVKEEAH